ncbi:MAG: NAD-dependent epimerase/dehydratase family protein [Candidatus Diapherotrites archaeon]
MAEKIVVTGGAGFIGSNLIEALLKKGDYEITVFDNFSLGYMKNLEAVKDKIKIVKGDICNYEELEKALNGAKYVFHMAALSYVGESIRKPVEYNKTNIDGTLNVLMAAHKNNVQRVLFPSTCIVYGETKANPIAETEPMNPNTPYGLTKQAGEFYCKFFTEVHGLDTICLRIFNAYGPRMQNRVLSIFANLILENKQPIVSGDGKQSRDFVFVEDIVNGFLKAMDAEKKHAGKSFNIGTGKGIDLNQLIEKINDYLGTKIEGKHSKIATGEIDVILADTRVSEKELGFKSNFSFEEGLAKTLDWIKENKK